MEAAPVTFTNDFININLQISRLPLVTIYLDIYTFFKDQY